MDSSDASSESDPGLPRPLWANYPPFSVVSESDLPDASDASDAPEPDSDSASVASYTSYICPDEEMETSLKEQPTEMLERLRALTAQRVPRGSNEELRRATNAFVRIARQFVMTEPEDTSLPASRENKKQWGDLIGLGVPEYLEDVVKDETLFDENPVSATIPLSWHSN